MKQIAISTAALTLLYAVGASQAFAADTRSCESRTKDQQVSLATSYIAQIQEHDPSAATTVPLVKEIFFGHVQEVEAALRSGANPNGTVDTGVGYASSFLEASVIACQPSIAVLLVKNGANVDGNGPSTPLVTAADNGMDRVVKFLLAKGANPEKEDFSGDTALRQAVVQGHYSTVKILLENHANPNHATHGGEPVLGNLATDPNDIKIAELLRKYGAVSK